MARIPVLIRFDPDDLERVDRIRGLRSRQEFLTSLVNRFVEHADGQPIEERTRQIGATNSPPYLPGAGSAQPPRAGLPDFQKLPQRREVLKPYRAPYGSRLKGGK